MTDYAALFSNTKIAEDLADALCSNDLMDKLKRIVATADPRISRVHLEMLRRDLTATFEAMGLPNPEAHAQRQVERVEATRALLHTTGGRA